LVGIGASSSVDGGTGGANSIFLASVDMEPRLAPRGRRRKNVGAA
jgi:hypothetical protein